MEKKRILFICVGNVCRSAMAEAIVRRYYNCIAEAESCGTHWGLPFIFLDEETRTVMREIGVDISTHKAHSYTKVSGGFDVVVMMSPKPIESIHDTKPNLSRARWVRWDVPDPRRMPLDFYRAVRILLQEKIADLMTAL